MSDQDVVIPHPNVGHRQQAKNQQVELRQLGGGQIGGGGECEARGNPAKEGRKKEEEGGRGQKRRRGGEKEVIATAEVLKSVDHAA